MAASTEAPDAAASCAASCTAVCTRAIARTAGGVPSFASTTISLARAFQSVTASAWAGPKKPRARQAAGMAERGADIFMAGSLGNGFAAHVKGGAVPPAFLGVQWGPWIWRGETFD